MFNSIGERLNNLSSIVINKVRKTLKAKQTEATEMDLICVVSTLSAIVATTGAAAFSQYEGKHLAFMWQRDESYLRI
jgi:potassium channel subfamily K protein 9